MSDSAPRLAPGGRRATLARGAPFGALDNDTPRSVCRTARRIGDGMHHGYMYGGSFELNYDGLGTGIETYRTTSGETHPLPIWPETVDGVRVWYMEKTGKKFFAVRLQFESHDIVLVHPVAIDPMRHMNNRRFSAQPTLVRDGEVSALLDDVIRENPETQPELAMLINRVNQVRRAGRAEKVR
jgi:hypothetical protein